MTSHQDFHDVLTRCTRWDYFNFGTSSVVFHKFRFFFFLRCLTWLISRLSMNLYGYDTLVTSDKILWTKYLLLSGWRSDYCYALPAPDGEGIFSSQETVFSATSSRGGHLRFELGESFIYGHCMWKLWTEHSMSLINLIWNIHQCTVLFTYLKFYPKIEMSRKAWIRYALCCNRIIIVIIRFL